MILIQERKTGRKRKSFFSLYTQKKTGKGKHTDRRKTDGRGKAVRPDKPEKLPEREKSPDEKINLGFLC